MHWLCRFLLCWSTVVHEMLIAKVSVFRGQLALQLLSPRVEDVAEKFYHSICNRELFLTLSQVLRGYDQYEHDTRKIRASFVSIE